LCKMSDSSTSYLVPEGGVYAKVPIPAIRSLVTDGYRGASRVLYALALHLGPGRVVVWPGYPTIALYAYISENGIRSALNILEDRGYISIEKKRIGRKFQNYYSILPEAYLLRNKQLKETKRSLDPAQKWICTSCYEDVEPGQAELIKQLDWEGKPDDHWKHSGCAFQNQSRRVLPAMRGILIDQANFRANRGTH